MKKIIIMLFTILLNSSLIFSSEAKTINVLITDVTLPYSIKINGKYKAYNYKYKSDIITDTITNEIEIVEHPKGLKIEDAGIFKEGIVFETDNGFTLNGKSYDGNIMFIPYKKDMIVINTVDLEKYVEAVLTEEIGLDWHSEAVKAQSVAARSYALFHILKNDGKLPYDVDNTTKFQVYKGRDRVNANIRNAVKDTSYQVLTYNSKIVPGYFSANCAGHTTSSLNAFGVYVPYLVGADCPYCLPYSKPWKATFSDNDLNMIFKPLNLKVDNNTKYLRNTDSNRKAESINVINGDNIKNISARDFRNLFTLDLVPSFTFDVEKSENGLLITGNGKGHGVGLCQWGAFGQAASGRIYTDILKHYYKDINVAIYTIINEELVPDIW